MKAWRIKDHFYCSHACAQDSVHPGEIRVAHVLPPGVLCDFCQRPMTSSIDDDVATLRRLKDQRGLV